MRRLVQPAVFHTARPLSLDVTSSAGINDPGWLAKLHALGHEAAGAVHAMAGALEALASGATAA
jgi:hypothetical protein